MYDGVTCHAAQGDNSTAALDAGRGKLRLDNGTRFANNWFRVGAAEVIYALPAPPGHYTNARVCKVVYAPCPEGCSSCLQDKSLTPSATTNSGSCTQPPYDTQPCPWSINLTANAYGEEILGLTLEKLLPGTYDQPEWPVPCSPGLLGATADSINGQGQLSALCAGLCPAGFYCSEYATTVAISCTQGHYCPLGTSAPLPCEEGSYSTRTDLSSAAQCVKTKPGFYAPTGSAEQTKCSPGTFQPIEGKASCDRCAAGTYQADEGEQKCVACKPGSYCPKGASAPLPCAEGTHSSSTSLTSAGACTKTDVGHFSPTGSTQQTPCSPGTVASTKGLGTCVPCTAGSFINASGQSGCLECPAGSICAARATAAMPCPGGTFAGSSGMRGFSDCEDAPPGFYTQAGSIAPTSCPSWGFCPGRGSIPIVIEEGQQTTTVTEVMEQAINQTVLELPLQVEVADVNAFNETAVRLRVADMLGLPLHAVSLNFGRSRRRMDLRAARSRRLDALDFIVIITDEPAVNITSAERVWKSKNISTLSAELGIDITDAPSPVVATEVMVQYVTVSTLVVAECPAGSWGANGECVLCPKGTHRPGGGNETGCLECPAGTYQPSLGGSECTVCGAGNYSANTLSCEPCQLGEYCPEDSVVGTLCPLGSTTEGRGAEYSDDCGCPRGTFNNTAAPRDSIRCTSCSDDMSCTLIGLTLTTVPLLPSRWRLSVNESQI